MNITSVDESPFVQEDDESTHTLVLAGVEVDGDRSIVGDENDE